MTEKQAGKSPAKRKRAPRKKKARTLGPVVTGSIASTVFAVLLFVASHFMRPDTDKPPKPDPDKPEPVDVVTEWDLAIQEFDKLGRRGVETAISRLESGELADSRAAQQYVLESTADAFESAFTPMSNVDTKTFADGWSIEKHAARLRDIITKPTNVEPVKSTPTQEDSK